MGIVAGTTRGHSGVGGCGCRPTVAVPAPAACLYRQLGRRRMVHGAMPVLDACPHGQLRGSCGHAGVGFIPAGTTRCTWGRGWRRGRAPAVGCERKRGYVCPWGVNHGSLHGSAVGAGWLWDISGYVTVVGAGFSWRRDTCHQSKQHCNKCPWDVNHAACPIQQAGMGHAACWPREAVES